MDSTTDQKIVSVPYFVYEGEQTRLLDGITFDKLADEFDLSPRHVKTIVYRAQANLFAHI